MGNFGGDITGIKPKEYAELNTHNYIWICRNFHKPLPLEGKIVAAFYTQKVKE